MLGAALAAPRDRRHALALMAASLALAGAGLSGCDGAPEGQLIPAVRMPAGVVPGMPDYYSSAHIEGGYAAGTVVKHFMGRPIKVEGNPFHPASLGATSPIAQAELLDFYDPRRSWGVTQANLPRSRSALEQALGEQRDKLAATGGAGFVILTGASTSPTLAAQLDALRRSYPQIRWLHWEAIGRENVDKRRRAGLWRAPRTQAPTPKRRRHSRHRQRSLERRAGASAHRARICGATQPDAGENESALRDRGHAVAHRRRRRRALYRRTARDAPQSCLRSPERCSAERPWKVRRGSTGSYRISRPIAGAPSSILDPITRRKRMRSCWR